jgi:WD40 repeat protein
MHTYSSYIWNARHPTMVRSGQWTARGQLTGHTDWVRALAAVPLADGTTLLASAGNDRAIFLWEPYASGRSTGIP